MSDSILDSTKQILGLGETYTPFDFDITTFINSAFTIVNQLGVGPDDGFFIEDNVATWDDLEIPNNQRMLVRTYIFLKVRMLFDPPTTSYLIESMNKQISELEWRLSAFREVARTIELAEEALEEVV
jgi:hypothetical protein